MSYVVEAHCHERRFGSAVRKQVIMFLANKASDDGSGIWCSKGFVQRHTELSETSVKRTISDFLREGILVQTGQQRPCKNGFTVVYRIDMDVVAQLELIGAPARTSAQTGSSEDGVRPDPGTGSPEDGVRGPQGTPNNPKTTPKPPTRAQEPGEEDLGKIWDAYPEDRRRDRPTSLKLARDALAEVTAAELLTAVKAYARHSAGHTRSKVSFSDNWFRLGKWRPFVEAARAEAHRPQEIAERQLSDAADAIRERKDWMYRHLPEDRVFQAVQRGLITREEAQAAGFLR
ncbi:hypothetical protein [Salipiger abyssi]|uniref:hypothetical protein n=1 Tax=Salipiger abyssi TaxID=1250539 RepID=UPI0040599084